MPGKLTRGEKPRKGKGDNKGREDKTEEISLSDPQTSAMCEGGN